MGKKQPAHEIKLGMNGVAILASESEVNDVWFNVVVSQLFKGGKMWKEATTLRHRDLSIVMNAIDMACAWAWRKQVQLHRAERDRAIELLANARR